MATSRPGSSPGGWDNRMNIADNPLARAVDALSDDDFSMLERAVAARKCRERIGAGTLAEAADRWRDSPPCPKCGGSPARDGKTAAGIARYRCPSCGARYTALSGTVLDNCKKDLPSWVAFVDAMRWAAPLDAAAEMCDITHQTAFEWRHRVFATVDGFQERVRLSGRVWIDELHVNDTDLSKGYGEARKRGLSKQKVCIAVGIDAGKRVVAKVCGHGKPTTKGIKAALASHIDAGATVVHDKEKSHRGLIREVGCADEAYKADVADPGYLGAMEMVNSLCSWLRRYLWRFTGMSPKNLQSYLNWYTYLFRVRQAREKWPETERVVRHLVMADASYRTSGAYGTTTLLDC